MTREKAIEILEGLAVPISAETAFDMAIDALEQPEIVRCKDCKHRDPEDHKCDCGHTILWQLPRDDDWFCADAEREEGEANG